MEESAVELERGRGVRVIVGEVHLGFEITTIIERIGVDDDESNVPIKDIIIIELQRCQSWLLASSCEGARADLNVDPLLLRKSLVLVLKDLACRHLGSVDGVQLTGQEQ